MDGLAVKSWADATQRFIALPDARTFYENATEIVDTHEPQNSEGWRDRASIGEIHNDHLERVLKALNAYDDRKQG